MSQFGYSLGEIVARVSSNGPLDEAKMKQEIKSKPLAESIMAVVTMTIAVVLDNHGDDVLQFAAMKALEVSVQKFVDIHDEEKVALEDRCRSLEATIAMMEG